MKRGKFIALEGGEGTGKSTHSRMLASDLTARGYEVVQTREPGGTPGAEAIRSLLLDPPGEGWGARAEALLFAAARSDHVEKLIGPALEAGQWVICDRFLDSSRAYQGGAGGVGDETILALHEIGSAGLRPDLAVLIEVPPAVIAERLSARDGGTSDAIGGRDSAYHAKVAQAFKTFADADPEGFAVVDGNAPRAEVHARIMAAITPLLEESR